MEWLRRLLALGRTPDAGRVRRVVVVVLEGLQPALIDLYLEQGLLHNLALLSDIGMRTPLHAVHPPLVDSLAAAATKHGVGARLLPALPVHSPRDLSAICAADRAQQEKLIAALSRVRPPLVVSVFEMPRQLVELFGLDPTPDQWQILRDVYARMDEVVGKAFSFIDDSSVLLVAIPGELLFASCPTDLLQPADAGVPAAVLRLLGVESRDG